MKILIDKIATVESVDMPTDFAGADDGIEASDDGGTVDLDNEMVGGP